jgi:hypothetical protein
LEHVRTIGTFIASVILAVLSLSAIVYAFIWLMWLVMNWIRILVETLPLPPF